MVIQFGKKVDIDNWMRLVEEISWNFPGLETKEKIEDHRKTVLRFIDKEQALCAKDDNEKIIGVLLFSRGHNMICCLGVSPAYRRYGIAPRALYKKFGFVEDKLIEEFGYPNQVFILHP